MFCTTTNTHVTGNKREKERGAAEVKVVVVETQGTVLYCTGTRVSSIYYTYCAGLSENGKKRKGEKIKKPRIDIIKKVKKKKKSMEQSQSNNNEMNDVNGFV